MLVEILLAAAALGAGAVAAVSGFGIGSVLTPLFATQVGMKLAVAAVSVPHLVGTAVRFWLMRDEVDRRVLWSFGVMSAAGGTLGALLHRYATGRALALVLGLLLVFAGIGGLSGVLQRMRFGRRSAWLAGALSGALGGLVGNQGGIRSAALLAFDIRKQAFIGTATAVALMVDGARMPFYFFTVGGEMVSMWRITLTMTLGVVLGTLLGLQVLTALPERAFRPVVSALILALGVFTLWTA